MSFTSALKEIRPTQSIDELIAAYERVTTFDYGSLVEHGQNILDDLGYSIPTDGRQKIADRINSNEKINRIINAQKWSEKKKREVLEKLPTMIAPYDVYRLVRGDSEQDRNTHTWDVYDEFKNIVDEEYKAAGAKVIRAVWAMRNRSPVSEEESKAMAAQLETSPNIKARLSRQKDGDYKRKDGYDRLQFDLARFYQLIAYQGESMKLDYTSPRANYSNTYRTINVGAQLTQTTLWHELAHSIEYDYPEILEMTKAFLKSVWKNQKVSEAYQTFIRTFTTGRYRSARTVTATTNWRSMMVHFHRM